MKNLIYMLALGWVCCIAGCNCRDCEDPTNPDCKNYDPCISGKRSAANAEFDIYELPHSGTKRAHYPNDTFYALELLYLAKDTASTYTWQIGAGRYSSKSVVLRMIDRVINSPYFITLSTFKDSSLICHSSDAKRDTKSKTIIGATDDEFIQRWCGTYLGYNEGFPQDTFRIKISNRPDSVSSNIVFAMLVEGLPISNLRFAVQDWHMIAYNEIRVNLETFPYGGPFSQNFFPRFESCYFTPDNKIVIEYNYQIDPLARELNAPRASKKFIGCKIL